MNFIILGDKPQKGMKSKGCVGLFKITRTHNIFEHQYAEIKKHFPKAKIIYISGFESKKFLSFLKKFGYNDVISINNSEFNIKNQAYSLNLARSFIGKDCFIILGSNILNKNIFTNFNKNYGSQIFISKNKNKNQIGCIINNNLVENLSFDLDNHVQNIYYLNYTATDSLKNLLFNAKNHNNFIFELINKLIDSGQIFRPYYIKNETKK